MAYNDFMTWVDNTITNAQDWDEFINGNAANEVVTRLNIKYPTLPRLIQIMLDKLLTFEMRGGWQANTAYHVKDLVTFNNTTYVATVEHTSSSDFNTDLNATKWAVYQLDLNNVVTFNKDFGTVLSTIAQIRINTAKSSFKFGLKGANGSFFDDNNNNFRGLPKPDEPWADENTGIGSTMFGRDNATYAYLSMANGHGCSNFGVASFAGGAGTGTGNPDVPNDGATYGYCSLAYGKNTQALGRISTAFGEENQANSVHSYSGGTESRSGAGLNTHPNALGGAGVVSSGDCAYSHGWRAYAYGDYSIAMGFAVGAYNSSMCFGAGVNSGTRLDNTLPNSLAMGYGVSIPTIIMSKNDGTVNGFGKLGINTKNPTERVDINIQSGDKVSVSVPANGTGSLDLQGKLSSGSNASIFRVEYTSPNAGSAYGVTNFYQNGAKSFSLNESGEVTFEKRIVMKNRLELGSYLMIGVNKVLGGQQSAIADSTGTAADNARAINAILAAMRGHGLIAS